MRRTSTGNKGHSNGHLLAMPGAPLKGASVPTNIPSQRDKPDRCYQRGDRGHGQCLQRFGCDYCRGIIFGAAVFAVAGIAGPGFARRSTLNGNVTEDAGVMTPGSAEATFTATDGNGVPLAQDWIAQWLPGVAWS